MYLTSILEIILEVLQSFHSKDQDTLIEQSNNYSN